MVCRTMSTLAPRTDRPDHPELLTTGRLLV
jgi:hypothetical protein